MPNRTLCDVLREMRDYVKAMDPAVNPRVLNSLIEEVQIMGNRMEAALWDQRDIKDLRDEIKKLKKKRNKLKKKLKGEDNE